MKRKTFDEIINESYMDYLLGEGLYRIPYNRQDEFDPLETENRNPIQVPWGTWRRLLFKHLNKHFYN